MKRLSLFLFLLSNIGAIAQTTNERLLALVKQEKFSEGITLAKNAGKLDAEGHFLQGLCYYYSNLDSSALTAFNVAVRMDGSKADYYYYRGQANAFQGVKEQAMADIDKAIALDPTQSKYYASKGEWLGRWGRQEEAITYYMQAATYPGCPIPLFNKLFLYFLEKKDYENADKYITMGAEQSKKGSKEHLLCLNSKAYIQSLRNDLPGAIVTSVELLSYNPDDYDAAQKLILFLYRNNEWERGDEWKRRLYEAAKAGKLPERLKGGFQFDEFMADGRRVMAVENMDEEEGGYYKHIFYVYDNQGKVAMTVQTECTPEVLAAKAKYVLGKSQNRVHDVYGSYLFNEQYSYPTLKESVIAIIIGSAKPSPIAAPTTDPLGNPQPAGAGEEQMVRKAKKGKKKQ